MDPWTYIDIYLLRGIKTSFILERRHEIFVALCTKGKSVYLSYLRLFEVATIPAVPI